jgi:diaminopimelate epimerase
MFLEFEKWQGCQNDFIVTWLSDADGDIVLGSLKRQATQLCHRRVGVGADGILVLHVHQRQDLLPYRLTIVNSDGSLAMNCGNGLRCAAMSVRRRVLSQTDEAPEVVELPITGTDWIPKVCRFIGKSRHQPLVAIEMGVIKLNAEVPWFADAKMTVHHAFGKIATDIGVAEIGNPHIIITTEDASRDLMLNIGPKLQTKPLHDGLNVHVVKPIALSPQDHTQAGRDIGQEIEDEGYQAWVYERGAGETMACGSGASAIAAHALSSGLLARDKWVVVDMPGGRLYVKHEDKQDPVILAGPAAFTYQGSIEI